MEKLDKFLNELDVPQPEETDFEQRLRNQLVRKYINAPKSFQVPFKLAAGFAGLLIIFAIGVITNPQLAYDINSYVFQNETPVNLEEMENLKTFRDDFRYTSINNPELAKELDPENYFEDKTYIIRKYRSSSNESIMLVSEMDPQRDTSPVKITY
jgi:hypothetical protein